MSSSEQKVEKASQIGPFVEFLIVAGTFMIPSMIMAGGADPDLILSLEYQLLSVLIGAPQIAFLLLFLHRSPGERIQAAGWTPIDRKLLMPTLRTVVLLFVVMGATGLIAVSLLGDPQLLPGAGRIGTDLGESRGAPVQLVVAVLLVSTLVNSYREELLYRGYAVSTLQAAGAGRRSALILAVALFAAAHLYQGLHGFIGAAAGGLLLCVLFLRRGEIHSLAWGHAVYNFVLIAARLFGPSLS